MLDLSECKEAEMVRAQRQWENNITPWVRVAVTRETGPEQAGAIALQLKSVSLTNQQAESKRKRA